MKKYIYYIYGLIVIFVGFILYKISQKIQNFGANNKSEDTIENNQDAVIEAINSIEVSNTTISDAKATLIAQSQVEAMSVFWGTDEIALFQTLNGLNVDDLNLIAQKFGAQPYSMLNTGLSDTWTNAIGDYTLQPLNIWYQYEISGDEMDSMRAIWSGTILDNTF